MCSQNYFHHLAELAGDKGDGIGRFENFIRQQYGICHRRGGNILLKCHDYDRREEPQRGQNCNISTSWSFWNLFSAISIVSVPYYSNDKILFCSKPIRSAVCEI